jgi:hypothetical protein
MIDEGMMGYEISDEYLWDLFHSIEIESAVSVEVAGHF